MSWSEYKKSIDSILNERITSPLFGAFALSWLIWNWKILYLTFIVSEEKIQGTKIDFIVANYSEFNYLFTYPLLSALFLILVYPFISTGAYWISLRFKKWQIEIKNEAENAKLLTIEESLKIREEVRNHEERYERIMSKKDNSLEISKKMNESLNQENKELRDKILKKETEYKKILKKMEMDLSEFYGALENEKEINKKLIGDNNKLNRKNIATEKELEITKLQLSSEMAKYQKLKNDSNNP